MARERFWCYQCGRICESVDELVWHFCSNAPMYLTVNILRITFGHWALALPAGFRTRLSERSYPEKIICATTPAYVLGESCNHD